MILYLLLGCIAGGVMLGAGGLSAAFAADPASNPPILRGSYDAILPPPAPLSPPPAKVEDTPESVAVASAGLRGGFDTNPTLAKGGRSNAISGVDAAFAGGSVSGNLTSAVTGEFSRSDYSANGIDPAEHYKLSFVLANKDQSRFALRSTSSIENTRAYNVRAFDAVQSVRVQWMETALRPFATAEVRYATLNETNAIFPEFFPDDQRFVRATAIPGVAYKQDKGEIGASLNLSLTRYEPAIDVFGFRRDNERVQPFVFYRYQEGDLSVFASVSRLYGYWHDPDFTNIARTMYELSLDKTFGAVSLSVAFKRLPGDTTFPISPITINSLAEGRASWAVGEKNTASLLVRDVETEYVDSPLTARAFTYGAGFTHMLMDDLSLGFELSRTEAITIAGDPVTATAGMLSLTKKFGSDKKRAASLPPADLGTRLSSQSRITAR